MPEVGCYSTDLYCDVPTCKGHIEYDGSTGFSRSSASYTGQTGAECRRQARKVGWRFLRLEGGTVVVCPRCKAQGRSGEARVNGDSGDSGEW